VPIHGRSAAKRPVAFKDENALSGASAKRSSDETAES